MPLDVGGLALFVILPGFVAYAMSYCLVDVKIRKSALEITLWSLFLSLLIYGIITVSASMSTSIPSTNFNILEAGNEPITIILLIVSTIIFGIIGAIFLQYDPMRRFRCFLTKKRYKKVPLDLWGETIGSWEGYALIETKDNTKFFGYINLQDEEKREVCIRGWGGSDETSNSQYYPIKMMDENNVAKPISDILRWDVEEIVFLEGDIKRVYLIPSKQSTGEDN
ncbi:MAG: hypothetical protein ACXQT2_05655 [Methanotrichaceae archaeon]